MPNNLLENITDKLYRREEQNPFDGYVPQRYIKTTAEWNKSNAEFVAAKVGEKLAKVMPINREADDKTVSDYYNSEKLSYPE